MKYIINILKNILQKDIPKPMGRWNIDYCNKKLNTKIDLSNEDHCGPCGQYAITKINLKNTINKSIACTKPINNKIIKYMK